MVSRVGFGSCHNQRKEQRHGVFDQLGRQGFDLFVWSGDAVYNQGSGVDTLQQAYAEMEQTGSYARFAATLPFGVVGTWDDHDFGTNDGGGEATPQLAERQALFQDFLGVAKDSPLRNRRGVYASHVFPGKRPEQSLKVILLDTRYARSAYLWSDLGSVGEGKWFGKLSPLAAAAVRTLSQLTYLSHWLAARQVSNHQMLAEEQWAWLERELRESNSSVHLVVSSVQVFTANPTVESWGLFPLEQQRLLALLNKAKPKGLLLLSGDVHVGQFAPLALPEVTSSGLTHTCTDGGVPRWLCSLAFNLFGSGEGASTLYDRNFGQVDIDWDEQHFTATVHSLSDPGRRMQLNRTFAPLGWDLRPVELQWQVRYSLLFLPIVGLGLMAILHRLLRRARR